MDGSTINNGKEEIKQNVDNQIPVTGVCIFSQI